MELITVDATFDQKTLEIFAKYNIKTPKLDEIVEFLKFDNLKGSGKKGIIIKPYNNQWIKDKGFSKEVSFRYSRFTTLLGTPLTIEMIEEEVNNEKYSEKIVKQEKPNRNNPLNN